jgi:glutathione reductase (NADPH)
MFDLPEFPRRLVVVGGGYIGCEMASIFRGLGARVTLLYRGEQILRGFDDDVRDFTRRRDAQGRRRRCACTDVRAASPPAPTARALLLTLSDGSTLIEADVVLYATGRHPNVGGWAWRKLGVKLDERRRHRRRCEAFATSVPGVYALGDVIGRMELTPVALAEAWRWSTTCSVQPGKARCAAWTTSNIPTAVFTHPPSAPWA